MTSISRAEWLSRYTNRIRSVAGWSIDEANEVALVALESGDAEHHTTPEAAADEEMSCWTSDEGAID